jgi:hypothetical protein
VAAGLVLRSPTTPRPLHVGHMAHSLYSQCTVTTRQTLASNITGRLILSALQPHSSTAPRPFLKNQLTRGPQAQLLRICLAHVHSTQSVTQLRSTIEYQSWLYQYPSLHVVRSLQPRKPPAGAQPSGGSASHHSSDLPAASHAVGSGIAHLGQQSRSNTQR